MNAFACPEPVEWAAHYGKDKAKQLMSLFMDRTKLESMPVHDFVGAFVK